MLMGRYLKKYHETGELDEEEIYPYRIEGLGKNLIPSATDFNSIDRYIKVTDAESAHMARKIAHAEGMFVGYTSGAAMQAVLQYHLEGEFTANSNVVVLFPDHGSRYMSKVYSDEWMENQGFLTDSKTKDTVKGGAVYQVRQSKTDNGPRLLFWSLFLFPEQAHCEVRKNIYFCS